MSIIIVGGGIIGTVLAQAISYLTSGKLSVHLIEALIPQTNKYSEFDVRSIALTQNTCHQLKLIGIWQSIADYATPIHSIHISDQGHAGFVTIEAHDYHVDALGYVIELRDIKLSLFHLLQKAPGVTVHCPALVTNFSRSEKSVNVILDDNKIINGRLLIAADGSNSSLATQCGILWQQKFYNQAAIVANIMTTIAHNKRAWERFTKYGPLAVLPISQDRCSLVWCHPLKRVNEVMFWSDKYFCIKLQKVFGWRLGRIIHVENRTAYPLSLIRAVRSISHRVVLVGNAAQTLHPVAGQGLNLGLRDVLSLAKILTQVWAEQKDYGSYSVLKLYQSQRKSDRTITISITDELIRLFANNWIPLVLGRNLGLIALELLTPMRDVLVRHALGWINH